VSPKYPSSNVEVLREFAGRWVAVRDGEVVDANDTFDGLVVRLRELRERGTTIMRVPSEGEPEPVGFG
jgi:hypothetical protein